MDILQAILLGILEGLTEFLPISSTGHLIVASDLLGYKDTAKIFTVVIQMGSIAAVVWYYRYDLINKIRGLINRDPATLRFWTAWVAATIPAVITGFLLKDALSVYAVSLTVAIMLIIGGILIWIIETYNKAPKNTSGRSHFEKLTVRQAIKVGLFQMLALVPGVSRSGATIMGGLLVGLDRVTAASFSFYLSIPVLILAGSYQLVKGHDELNTVSGGAPALLVGTIAAFITALLVIKWLLRYISKHDFKVFAYYRIILGVIILVALVA
ncbi:MAG: undecaprenyl-diphosphate phosphatase [Candidatus Saccharimonadales bacterium]